MRRVLGRRKNQDKLRIKNFEDQQEKGERRHTLETICYPEHSIIYL